MRTYLQRWRLAPLRLLIGDGFIAHVTRDGPQFGPPGYETDLLYLAGLTTLVLARKESP